ncbi:hypothetical protein NP493_1078g02071 [Ridgeia piscesae]|uniref:Solute carrier family 43 member 3 n=1 Tax=Ridgeia piscesae TaxID=27915 RepID=A0AAD9KHF7_RIDPI|nr:hypothetical protein NP493_1078g02071 [Ridgeia piscesae]
MPRRHIPFPPPKNYRLTFGCRKTPPPPLQEEVGREDTTDKKDSSRSPVDEQSFKTIAASSLYLLDILWLTCHRFQSWSFVGRLNAILNRLANNDKDIVSAYLSVYAIMQFFGIFLAPLSGLLMDRKSHADAPPQIKKIERLEMCLASFIIDTTLGLLLAVVVFLPVLELQYVAFLLHVVHRALLYGPNSAFIAQVYGPQHFGKLFGLAMSCSAAFSMLQYPLFVLVQGPLEGDPFVFNMVVLVLMVVSFVHPVYIWRRCRVDRRAFNAEVAAAQPLNQAEVNL